MSIRDDPEFKKLLNKYVKLDNKYYDIKRYINETVLSDKTAHFLTCELEQAAGCYKSAYYDICHFIDRYVEDEIKEREGLKRLKERMEECYKKFEELKESNSKDVYYTFDQRIFVEAFEPILIDLLKKELSLINNLILNVYGFGISIAVDSSDVFSVKLVIYPYPNDRYRVVKFIETFNINHSPRLNVTKLANSFMEKINKAVLEHTAK